MVTIQDVNAEQLAKLLYRYREALSQECPPQMKNQDAWERASEKERQLVSNAMRLALLELSAPPAPSAKSRKYYATPGEADWGC